MKLEILKNLNLLNLHQFTAIWSKTKEKMLLGNLNGQDQKRFWLALMLQQEVLMLMTLMLLSKWGADKLTASSIEQAELQGKVKTV
jgi:hypothetical protein